jgi:uncharacterized protein YdhG (YjbR/CyaY superfamily)
MAAGPTIDEYFARCTNSQRAALERLRRLIRSVAPHAEECVSYGIAAFREKRMIVGIGAAAKHCSLYLMSTAALAAHEGDLAGYDTSKGTVHFRPDEPLPAALVRKLVRARLAENAARDRTVRGRRAARRKGGSRGAPKARRRT